MADSNPENKAKRYNRSLVFLAFAGIAFIVFGVLVQVGILELEPGDGALNIIGGMIILAAIPFMWKKRDIS